KQPHKQLTVLIHPELLRLQIAFLRAHHMDGLTLPSLVVNLRKVVALALDDLRRGLGSLAIDVKSQHQKHVHKGTSSCFLVRVEYRERPIDHEESVAIAWSPNVDAQFPGHSDRLMPGFDLAGAIRVVSCALLR